MFKRLNKIKDLIFLHVAGATVRHKSCFSNLKVIENKEPLENEFLQKYVVPFYLGSKDTDDFRKKYLELRGGINVELVSKLLGDFNWRPRSVGAYFAALGSMNELEENIGNLLLRSDVCYAGHDYCLALASFSTQTSIQFLNQYLEYYLQQSDLWFDQNSAMAALAFIGNKKGEDLTAQHMTSWQKFVKNKPNWNLAASIEGFARKMDSLNGLKHDTRN